jgi:hypothetical protein
MSGTVSIPTYTYYEIPTIASPQSFSIPLAGISYNMSLTYHNYYPGILGVPTGIATDNGSNIDTNVIGGWVLDISDINNNPIICGIPLVTGIDLLYQYQYLGIGGSLIVATDGSPDTPPTFDNLGSTGHVYFVVVGTTS